MTRTTLVAALLTLLLGFVAGTAFGLLLGGDGEVDGPRAATPRVETQRAARESETEPPAEAQAGRRRTSPTQAAADQARGTASNFDLVPVPGTLSGVVVANDGAPIAGATVRATAERDVDDDEDERPGSGPPPIDDEAAAVKRAIEQHRWEAATTREALTGPDGKYEIADLVDTKYGLHAYKEGWKFEAVGNAWESLEPGGARDFTGTRVHVLRVDVLLPGGATAEKARVERKLVDGDNSYDDEWKPDDPEMALEPGTWTVSARGGPRNVYRSNSVDVEIGEEGVTAPVTLQLEERPGIAGKLIFTGAERPLRAGVKVLRYEGGDEPSDRRLLMSSNADWPKAEKDEDVEYAVADLLPGRYLVGLVLRSGTVLERLTVDVGDVLAHHDFTVASDARDWVTLWVRDPTGKPVRNAQISVGFDSSAGSFDGNRSYTPQADGSYRIPHQSPAAPDDDFQGWSRSISDEENYPDDVTNFVEVTAPRYGSKRIEYDPTTDAEIVAEFGEPAFVIATISGYSGSSVARELDVSVHAVKHRRTRQRRDWRWESEWSVRPDGTIRVGPIEPGQADVVLWIRESDHYFRQIAVVPLTVQAGDNEITLTVPALHELRVTTGEPELAVALWAPSDLAGEWFHVSGGSSEDDGRIYSSLPAGTYKLATEGAEVSGEMLVRVPHTGPVRFVPRPYDALRIDRHDHDDDDDEQPYVVEVGLVDGDLIIAIDGTEFENGPQIDVLLAAAQTRDKVTLTVLSGGSTTDIEVDPKKLQNGASLNKTVR